MGGSSPEGSYLKMSVTINWVNQPKKTEHSCIRIPSSAGILAIHQSGHVLTKTEWHIQNTEPLPVLNDKQCIQIQQYLNNPAYRLDINLQKQGSDFRNQVWVEICRIPAGQVLSYSDLAKIIDSGARAVANACRDNPFPGIIPCHRVVARDGLGGYMGETSGKCMEIKKKLLNMESQLGLFIEST